MKPKATTKFLLTVLIGSLRCAIETDNIVEIVPMMYIVPLPGIPAFVRGIINLRDRLIPILDIRNRISMDFDDINRDTRIIIFQVGKNPAGFLVDSVEKVIEVALSELFPPPDIVVGLEKKFLKGICHSQDVFYPVINLSDSITSDEMGVLQELESKDWNRG